jgi:hypothetical protein
MQKGAGVGVRQNFGVGEGINICDNFARPRFDETAGASFAGGVLVFDCDGERLALIFGAGAALRAAAVRQRVTGESERRAVFFSERCHDVPLV